MYDYAGNNPVKYTDPDGRTDIFWNFRDFMNFLGDSGDTSAKFYNLMKSADEGDEFAKETLKYVFHEVGRETLKEISEVSGYASVVCLAIGQPEGAAAFAWISTGADILLAFDDFRQGNCTESLKEGVIIVAGIITPVVIDKGVTSYSKSIKIIIGSTGRNYEISHMSENALRKLLAKDIADGYFGENVIPNAPFIIEQTVNAYKKLTEVNDE